MKLTKKYLINLINEVISELEDEKDKDGKKILNDDDLGNVNDVSTGRWHADDVDECDTDIKEEDDNDEDIEEVAPPGWEGTVKAMKKHKEIDNPWSLAWSMKNKGYKSHKK